MLSELKSRKKKAFDPFKADLYSFGLTILMVCSLGKFSLAERISYSTNSQDHRHYIKQNRTRFIKKNYSMSGLNRIVKLMLEDD
jgi:hypothetical protein